MKLLTKEIEKKLAKYPLYSQDGKGKDAVIICKFFTPDAKFTWWVLEGSKERYEYGEDWTFYGIVDNGFNKEYGYFTLKQLKEIRGVLNLPVEREMYGITASIVGQIED